MANATVSRLGAVNNTTGNYAQDNALFMKVFSGEVMTSFEDNNVAMDLHMVRTISQGKSAQFPVMGKTVAEYHTPGTEITGDQIKHNEVVLTVNELLLSSTFIANIDEAKNHYDVRSVYSNELGRALAKQFDRHVLQTVAQAALETTPNIAAGGGDAGTAGTIITDADADTDTTSFIASVFDAATAMDEKDVPSEDRYLIVSPATYYRLANNSQILHSDFGNAGNGSAREGKVLEVAGFKIVKTNNLPTTNITTGVSAGSEGRQAVDARNTVALFMQKSAVGTVKLMDLATESEYDIRRQGTLMVAKYAMGHGVLRPEAAGIIRTATPI